MLEDGSIRVRSRMILISLDSRLRGNDGADREELLGIRHSRAGGNPEQYLRLGVCLRPVRRLPGSAQITPQPHG